MNLSTVYSCLFLILSLPVFSLANPTVDLGPDVTACGTYLLDANNTGATYSWSTGQSSQQITVSTSGTYWVDVTDNTGTTRDSVYVEILENVAPPIVNDTSFCGAGQHSFNIQNQTAYALAYSAPSGGTLLGIGRPNLALSLDESQMVYISNADGAQTHLGPSEAQGKTSTLLTNGAKGTFFDVHQTIIFDSLDVFTIGNTNILLELKDSDNNVIQSKTVSLTGEGKQSIYVGFQIPPGENYSLIGTPSNRLGYIVPGASYPYSIPGILDITRSTHPSNLTVSYYFYDWVVSYWGCPSDRVEVEVEIAESPEVDLGDDRANCGPTSLDATNNNATYLWSTGETSPSITVNATDTISVDARIGNCVTSDKVFLEILDVPTAPSVVNQSSCGPEEATFINQNTSGLTLWYDAQTGGQVVGSGDTLVKSLSSNTTFYVESATVAELTIGEKEPLDNDLDLFAGGPRGIIFDVMEPIIIEQISVFADIPLRLFVELQDAEGNVLQTTNKWIPRGEGNESFVPLNFLILPGTDYKLIGYPQSFGRLAYLFPDLNFPYDIPDVVSIKKSTHPSRFLDTYYTFFNWVIKYPKCRTERLPVSYDISIPLDLGEAKYTCDTEVLDTQLPSLNHRWSNGATTSSIQVNEPGTYWVEIDDGQGCLVRDSVELNFPAPLNLGPDGVLCGNEILTGYSSEAEFLWNTGATTPNLTATQPGTYSVRVIEPQGCELTDEITITSFDTFPEVNLGNDQVVCGSLLLDAGNPGARYEWSHGPTTQTVEVSSSGAYVVTVYNDNDCATSDTVNIATIQAPESFFAFSKNGLDVSFNNLSSFGNYLWNFGDGEISLGINPTHTYLEAGTYEVSLIVSNSCASDTMTASITVNPVGIFDQNWEGTVSVFPNPTEDNLNVLIESVQNAEVLALNLIDIRGKVVYKEQVRMVSHQYQHRLSLPDLTKGIYILTLRQGNKFYRQKVMIE